MSTYAAYVLAQPLTGSLRELQCLLASWTMDPYFPKLTNLRQHPDDGCWRHADCTTSRSHTVHAPSRSPLGAATSPLRVMAIAVLAGQTATATDLRPQTSHRRAVDAVLRSPSPHAAPSMSRRRPMSGLDFHRRADRRLKTMSAAHSTTEQDRVGPKSSGRDPKQRVSSGGQGV